MKKSTDVENANSYTIGDCNAEYNQGVEDYKGKINQAFKDL